MATAVQLSLELDPGGSLSVLDGFKQRWQSFVSSVNGSLPQLKNAAKGMDDIAVKETQAHEAGMLFTRTLGIEMPRALETVMAKSQLLGPILAAGFQVSVFAAAIPVLVEIGNKFKDLMNDAGGYTEQVRSAYAETVKASNEALVNPESLTVAKAHNALLLTQVDTLNKAATLDTKRTDILKMDMPLQEKITGFLFSGTVHAAASAELTAKATGKDSERLQVMQAQTKEQLSMLQLQDQGVAKQHEAGLQGYALAKQQLDDFTNSKLYTDMKRKNAEAANAELLVHQGEFNNAVLNLERQNADQTIALRHSVVEEHLVGIAKIQQVESDEIANVTRQENQSLINHKNAQAQRALIVQKASQQIIEYQRQETDATKAMQDEAALAGLRGDAKIIASAEVKMDKIREDYARGVIDYENYAARIQAADTLRNNELLQAEKDRLRKTKELQGQAAEDQKTAEEDATLAILPEWQRQTASLEIELNRRLRNIQDEKIRELSAEQLTADQVVAINQIADAKRYDAIVTTNARIKEENKRNVEQLGSDLSSLYDDIAGGNLGKRIIANMKKLFFQILAEWILTSQQMKSIFGGIFGTALFGPGSTESQMGQGGGGGGGLGSILGGLLGGGSSSGGGGLFGGGSSSQSFAAPGTPAFFSGAGGGSSSSAGSIFGGGDSSSAAASNSATSSDPLTNGALSGLNSIFNPSGGLTTQSLSASGILGGSPSSSSSAGGKGLFGGLFQGGTTNGLLQLGGIAASLFGGKIGGTTGQIGGMLMGLLLTGKLGGVISTLYGTSLGLAGTGALVGGAVGGLLGFGVGSSSGGLLGSLAGIGSGALSGFLVGGPIGALVGGIVGLLGGIFGGIFGGSKRKHAAQDYFANQVQPSIKQIVDQYEAHGMDYTTATGNLEQLRTQAQEQMKGLKGEGKSEFRKFISPAIDAAEKQINNDETERNRRAGLVFGPPQFHDGGFVNAMISQWTTKPGELLALLKHGEMVMTPEATSRNRGKLENMNAGGTGGETHNHYWTINAFDANSVDKWMRNGGAKALAKGMSRYNITEGNG